MSDAISTDANELLPRLVVRNEDSVWLHDWIPAKYTGCFNTSECAYKRFKMPEGWFKEENIIDDYNYPKP